MSKNNTQISDSKELLHYFKVKGYIKSEKVFNYNCEELFWGISLENKSLLDIGSGKGLHSLWASIHGLSNVVALEPDHEGSSSKSYDICREILIEREIKKYDLIPETIQDYESEVPFDIILLHNSINHLDEYACINLLVDEQSYMKFTEIFSKILSLLKPDGKIIITDCSNDNFFNDNRYFRSPFALTIEWDKHQNPDTWIDLLRTVGFINPHVSWAVIYLFRYLKPIFSKKKVAYFISSNFKIIIDK